MAYGFSKLSVYGIGITPTTYDEVCDAIRDRARERALTIACCNVHSVMSARRDPALRAALEDADIATPDGMPLVWALNLEHGVGLRSRVYGPDLMRAALKRGVEEGWRHYFYGATEPTLEKLEAAARRLAPGLVVAGVEAPPFRQLSDAELAAAAGRMRAVAPDVVWLGLGMPKQELMMPRLRAHLPGAAIVGVGAAFDFLAGNVPQAPALLQDHGLEWAYRLAHEPARLWRRYLVNNPAYLLLLGGSCLRRAASGRRATR